MNQRWKMLAGLLLVSLVLACGGGGGGNGGGGGPTQPAGHTLIITFTFGTTLRGGAVHEALVALDGREVARRTWPGSGCVSPCSILATVPDVRSGQHTLALTIVRQSRTVITYTVRGQVVSDSQSANIDMTREGVSLRAGQSVTYNLSV